ncbi:heterokaryon incompatibility protein-domain-containing protein, partial [Rhypophila decipiens]
TLDTCQVDSHPEFYALSYVWGSDAKTQKIVCNGKELGVTESVHAALASLRGTLTLRLEETGTPIWIDAICINQDDNDERSRQVARMDWIYREAKCVIVWLGKGDAQTDFAMSNMEHLATILSNIEAEQKLLAEELEPKWTTGFRRSPLCWHERLWTFQEAVLSRSLQFVCGDFMVNSEAFMTVVHGLAKYELRWLFGNNPLHHGFAGFGAIIDAKQNAVGAAGLLTVTAERQCKEPLDRIYGLLSSMPGEFRRKILVLYTRDINEVYVEMGKACLEEANSL